LCEAQVIGEAEPGAAGEIQLRVEHQRLGERRSEQRFELTRERFRAEDRYDAAAVAGHAGVLGRAGGADYAVVSGAQVAAPCELRPLGRAYVQLARARSAAALSFASFSASG
jgi:hypothetical protein